MQNLFFPLERIILKESRFFGSHNRPGACTKIEQICPL